MWSRALGATYKKKRLAGVFFYLVTRTGIEPVLQP